MNRLRREWPRDVVLVLLALLFLAPLLLAFNASLKPPAEIMHALALPVAPGWDNYRRAWQAIGGSLLNTVAITVPSVVLSIAVGCLAGFPLSQMKPRHGRAVYVLLLTGMFVPYQAVQIPAFYLIRMVGLYNTIPALWVVHLAYGVPFCTFFMRNFFASVPRSMFEAAQLDGCGPAGYFFRILMPASISGLAALAIVQSRGIWNDMLFALTMISRPSSQPVTVRIYGMVGVYETDQGMLMAATLMSVLPMLLVFLAFQKAFTRGLLSGGAK